MFPTSSIDVESLLVLLPFDGLVQQDDRFFVETFEETFDSEVIVC